MTFPRSRTYALRYSYRCVVAARSAFSYGMRFTPSRPRSINSFARASIQLVTPLSAGPPVGGVDFEPPVVRGLGGRGTTVASARPPPVPPPVVPQMAVGNPGVGG